MVPLAQTYAPNLRLNHERRVSARERPCLLFLSLANRNSTTLESMTNETYNKGSVYENMEVTCGSVSWQWSLFVSTPRPRTRSLNARLRVMCTKRQGESRALKKKNGPGNRWLPCYGLPPDEFV